MVSSALAGAHKHFPALFRLIGQVRKEELGSVVLLSANCFVALLAYYVLKVVREPLILSSGGAEAKSYAAAAQALLLIGLLPLYGRFLHRVDRSKLVRGVVLTFIVCIELFWVGNALSVPYLGFLFFVWVGIFGLALVAQFWSLANDLHGTRTGERLFPVIALGAPLGSLAGSILSRELIRLGLGPGALLQIAAGLLVVHVLLYSMILQRHEAAPSASQPTHPTTKEMANGIFLVWQSPYLTRIALLLVALSLVNTTGEFILSSGVTAQAKQAFAIAVQADAGLDRKQFFDTFIGGFYADIFTLVNIATILLQAFVASRLVRGFGIAGVLLALPIVALGVYGVIAAGASLAVVRLAKVLENSTDYSLMNTARAMLWLPTARVEKYAGKQAVDTFFVRIGDVLSAMTIFAATLALGGVEALSENTSSLRMLAGLNLIVIAAWLALTLSLVRRYQKLADSSAATTLSGRSSPTTS